ncbi:MAG TPA: hypothetical protein DEA73_08710 [Peptococcaceae bacterium]|nr:hypothetical protein [Peptococcaceae bacterium]
MPGRDARFRDAIIRYVNSWGEDIEVLKEKPVGYRFVGTPRVLDIVLRHGGRYMGIEAKLQESSGTAYQKLSYALEDCLACPIPTIIVFAGGGIREDMKTKLILSGRGIEVSFLSSDEQDPEKDRIEDPHLLLRQRVLLSFFQPLSQPFIYFPS